MGSIEPVRTGKKFRIYMTIDRAKAEKVIPKFIEAYLKKDKKRVVDYIDSELVKNVEKRQLDLDFPSLNFPPRSNGKKDYQDQTSEAAVIAGLSQLVLPFASDDADLLSTVRASAQEFVAFLAVGTDLIFDAVDHWCPGKPQGHLFGDRAAANNLVRAAALADENLDGDNVNVVIIDRGLNEDDILNRMNGKFGGGWVHCPQGAPPCIRPGTLKFVRGVTNNYHGMMVARNVLSVAPAVTLYDLPLIPARITSIPKFLADAQAAFNRILVDLKVDEAIENGERWILVNAWAIFDRATEMPPGDYSTNPKHPFNLLIGEMADHNIDFVFAAGNCGQFCPDLRCSPYDRGPGKSIFGANSYRRVLSVGAVRTDGTWIGSSSQGPGPAALAKEKPDLNEKPDLTAPSMFTERNDRHTRNGGTSAACAVAAGVLAALRQRWGPVYVPPDQMNRYLRDSAWRIGPSGWDGRLGCGVINAEAVLKKLPPPLKAPAQPSPIP